MDIQSFNTKKLASSVKSAMVFEDSAKKASVFVEGLLSSVTVTKNGKTTTTKVYSTDVSVGEDGFIARLLRVERESVKDRRDLYEDKKSEDDYYKRKKRQEEYKEYVEFLNRKSAEAKVFKGMVVRRSKAFGKTDKINAAEELVKRVWSLRGKSKNETDLLLADDEFEYVE